MSGSREFFYMEDGIRKDAALHDFILDNPKADRLNRIDTAKRAVFGGMLPKDASELYGVKESDL
tara:strand:- start:1255 stop:1446 length:192 start_codon:yes stop_codon:yes gene_type:complete